MILSRGKPTRAAEVMAVPLIPAPAPQNVTQSAFAWRICSHCDCCSRPGGAIGISIRLISQSLRDLAHRRQRFAAVGGVDVKVHDRLALHLLDAAFLLLDEVQLHWRSATSNGRARNTHGQTRPSAASVRP